MVSTAPKTFFARILRIGYRCGLTQIGWDRESNSLKYETNAFRYAWVRVQLAVVLAYCFFLFYKCCMTYTDPSLEPRKKIRIQYVTLAYFLLNINHVVGVLNGMNYVKLISGFQQFVQTQLRNGLPNSKRTKRFAMLMMMMNIVGVIQGTLPVFLSPGSSRALTSLSGNPKQLPLGTKCLAAFVHFIISSFHLFGHWLQTVTIFSYACDLVSTIKTMHESTKSNPLKVAKQQRALSILQTNYSLLYAQWNMVMEILCIVFIVLNLYIAVEFGSLRSLQMAVGSSVASCSAWRVLGDVHETSKKGLTEWKRSETVGNSGWSRRFLRSCRPISIPLGSFFYVDRKFILTFASIIINSASSLILAE